MIIVDAGRPDYFGCYGSALAATPNIDKLAAQSALFEHVIATAPWTVPSHGSLFTGLYPHQHGATWQTLRLRKDIPTIFDIFTERGYHAVALSANSLIVSPYNMFGRNTRILGAVPGNDPDVSSFAGDFDYRRTSAEQISGCFIDFLKERPFNQPVIAYINFYDLHAKYKAREPFYSRYVTKGQDKIISQIGDFYALHFKEMNDEIEVSAESASALRAFYAAKLAMIDAEIGKVLEALKESGILENSILVVTSDHGDILGDHNKPSFHHQFSIYNSLLNIPLIFYWKDKISPARLDTPLIQNTDVLPTLLELCGMEKPSLLDDSPGVSLARHMAGVGSRASPRNCAISMYEGPARFILRNRKKVNPRYLRSLMAIQDAEYKLIFSDKGDNELYHLKSDQRENKNIARDFPVLVSRLKEAFYKIIDRYKENKDDSGGGAYSFDEEERIVARLKALGYIE